MVKEGGTKRKVKNKEAAGGPSLSLVLSLSLSLMSSLKSKREKRRTTLNRQRIKGQETKRSEIHKGRHASSQESIEDV